MWGYELERAHINVWTGLAVRASRPPPWPTSPRDGEAGAGAEPGAGGLVTGERRQSRKRIAGSYAVPHADAAPTRETLSLSKTVKTLP